MSKITTVGIAGATGYAGQELIRLAARHPGVRETGDAFTKRLPLQDQISLLCAQR